MALLFVLGMPGNNAWNGKWSGEGMFFADIRRFSKSKISGVRQEMILERGYFTYDFGDGWVASVTVSEVKGSDITAASRRSQGFCGYDWMVSSIIRAGGIFARHQEESAQRAKEEWEKALRKKMKALT